MKQVQELLREVLTEGSLRHNRTGKNAYSLPGMCLKHDMTKGFPAVTTKKLPFKSSTGEMVGFLRAYSNASDFRALGCKVWDQNANENKDWLANPRRMGVDDLGEIYGVQWRKWPAFKEIPEGEVARIDAYIKDGYEIISSSEGENSSKSLILYKSIDQVKMCLDLIMNDPDSRRILFHGWNLAELSDMALVPCHTLYSWYANKETKELSLTLFIRSNDLGLGLPFNLSGGAVLLSLFARLTGYTPKWFTYFIGDAHIYEDQVDMVTEMLNREPFPLPTLKISDRVPSYAETGVFEPEWLEKIEPSDFSLENYRHHAPLTAPMAV
jgi:thymidylate synthase